MAIMRPALPGLRFACPGLHADTPFRGACRVNDNPGLRFACPGVALLLEIGLKIILGIAGKGGEYFQK